MPRVFSATTDILRQRRAGGMIPLLELTLHRDRFGPNPTSTTFRLSDVPRQALGQTWEPDVVQWGTLSQDLDGAPRLDLTLANTARLGGRDRFSDLLRAGLNQAGTFEAHLVGEAKLILLPAGGTTGDEIPMHRFVVEEPARISSMGLQLRLAGFERYLGTIIGSFIIGVDSVGHGGGGPGVSLISYVQTVTVSALNRLMLVGITLGQAGANERVGSVTIGGAPATFFGFRESPLASATIRQEWWGLAGIPTGALTIAVTIASDVAHGISTVVGSLCLTGIHQTTPVGLYQSAIGTTPTPALTLVSRASEVVVDNVGFFFEAGNLPIVIATAGQAVRWNRTDQASPGDTTHNVRGAGATKAGALSVNLGWQIEHPPGSPVARNWVLAAITAKPAPKP